MQGGNSAPVQLRPRPLDLFADLALRCICIRKGFVSGLYPRAGPLSRRGASMANLLDAALWYAKRGWHVFPCRPGGKVPLTEHGVNDATTNEGIIRAWWAAHPTANIGLACGPSGLAVIDVDVKHGKPGLRSWYDLLELHGGALADTVVAETPSGGMHMFYRQNGTPVPSSVDKLGEGIDTRGVGGYVVVPPSTTEAGVYQWAYESGVHEREMALFPNALLDDLAGRREPAPSVEGGIPAGSRNVTMASLAGSMRRRGMSAAAIEGALLVENAQLSDPLPEDEVRKVARSIAKYPPAREGEDIPLTDLGNAERLIAAHGEDLRFCAQLGGWLVWDGRRWARDMTGEVQRKAQGVVRALYAEAASCNDGDRRREIARFARSCENASRQRAMLDLAWSQLGICVLPDGFDADPWLFNCANGTLDLRTGGLRPHAREDLLTVLCPVNYNPEAKADRWFEFEMQISGGDINLVCHKQRAFGYALTGMTTEQCLFILFGTGANGKSTELGVIRQVLGDDYALHTPTETLLVNSRGSGIPNDVARLRGARYVTAVEAEGGRRLAESLIKQMTGGDPIAARFMRAEWFEFMPTHKLFLAVNHKPIIRGGDHGIWRRIRLWPYTTTIAEADQDKDLPDKLHAEAEGILAWLVEGCLEWRRLGLGMPDSVAAATENYRAEMDVVGGFIAEMCVEGPGVTVGARELYDAYAGWAEASGEHPLTKTAFGLRLQERGLEHTRARAARGWRGIGLLATAT